MKGALVTGATTPLGRAVVRALLGEGTPVIAVGAERELGESDENLLYLAVDLTRSRDLRDLLFGAARDRGVDVVVHCAHHRSLRARGPSAHDLNVETTREMLQLAERHPTLRRFVYVGSAEVYRRDPALPALIGEDHPIEMSPSMPQRLRDRVEADLTVCARSGLSERSLAVLRLAELVAPGSGSQLADYLASRVCLRPLGFDPLIEAISIEDAVRAIVLAAQSTAQGAFNVPGADVLPLSAAIEAAERVSIAIPGPAIGPLYAARAMTRGTEFDWTLNRWRFRFGGVLDGARARDVLGYEPRHRIDWSGIAHAPRSPR